MKLKSITFRFDNGSVDWEYQGRGEINGRTYPTTYKVIVNKTGYLPQFFRTSMQANVTNSKDYIKTK